MGKYLSEGVGSKYPDALTVYNTENSSTTTSNPHKYLGKISGVVKKGGKFLWKHKGKIAAGALIAGGLAVIASIRGVGYSIKTVPSIVEVIVKELDFNPYLHPITNILGEGTIRFSEDFINNPGVIRVSVGNTLRETLNGYMVEILHIVKPYVLNSTVRNIPYYLGVGEAISFGTYRIKKFIERRGKNR